MYYICKVNDELFFSTHIHVPEIFIVINFHKIVLPCKKANISSSQLYSTIQYSTQLNTHASTQQYKSCLVTWISCYDSLLITYSNHWLLELIKAHPHIHQEDYCGTVTHYYMLVILKFTHASQIEINLLQLNSSFTTNLDMHLCC